MVALFTSHWRSPLLVDLDATIVSISRGEPRWRLPFSYRRMRSLAPGNEAWAQKDPEAFERAYLDQLDDLGAEHILAELERIANGKPCLLVCWEKLADPNEFCHRRVLAERLRAMTGIEVPELRPGDLPQRQDTLEPRLF
ncbi:MAG: DUF488 domain-containing protein [Actinomycetota bacterium]|nr:DUF488 domain-containing protein [Actinomycetota bacterium]